MCASTSKPATALYDQRAPGWNSSGVYGTHFWVDPKENLVGIVLAQTSSRNFLADFENAVLQAVAVHPAIIREALTKVYKVEPLLEELGLAN